MLPIVREICPALLAEPGIGTLVAAQVILSWSHAGRCRDEAAFARLAGVAPKENSRHGNGALVWPGAPMRVEPLEIRGA